MQMLVKKYLYLPSGHHSRMEVASVCEAMTSHVHVFCGVETVGNILRVLKNTTHNAYPVCSNGSKLIGVIRRDMLMSVLHLKAFGTWQQAELQNGWLSSIIQVFKSLESKSKHAAVSSLTFSEEEFAIDVDIRLVHRSAAGKL